MIRAAWRRLAHCLFGVAVAWRVLSAQSPANIAGLIALDSGRVTVVTDSADLAIGRALLRNALSQDSFPGLPRPRQRVLLFIAPDVRRFREWSGGRVPEWGAAIAFPALSRIIMQGSRASSAAGDPVQALRHELAHLALHEALGELPPRWFDEGYASVAAGEVEGESVPMANLVLALRGIPRLEELDGFFAAGGSRARTGYSLAARAVEEIARSDPDRGLVLFFRHWKSSGSFDVALRRAYGLTTETLESRWRARTRLRYGALAVATDLSLGSLVLLVLLGPLWWSRRRRDRERMARLRVADQEQERRDRESALAAFLGEGAPPSGGEGEPPRTAGREGIE